MKNLNELRFGTAGIPFSTLPRNTVNGISQVKKLGLHAMELEFVQSVNITQEAAPLVKKASEENNVILTCHGQYFINLNSLDAKKIMASQQRIYIAAKRAFECGAWSMCFHAAFYQGQSQEKTFKQVHDSLKEVVSDLRNEGIEIWVRPETMGKQTQFGTIEEVIELSQKIEGVLPCIDFSHLHARTNGKFNTYEDFKGVLELIEKDLGKQALKNMHIHAQGVEFSEKGEKRHLPFSSSKFDYSTLAKCLKDFSAKGVVICESPIMEEDTLLLQKAYDKA